MGTLNRAILRLACLGARAAMVPITIGIACGALWCAQIQELNQLPAQANSTTWNPSEGAPIGAQFVGRAVCGGCHVSEGETQQTTPMAEAAESAAEFRILRDHPRLSLKLGPYTYEIMRRETASDYSVNDGKQSVTEPILWAFGKGEAGQTYVFTHAGAYYQSRVSFFNDVQKLDLTLGASLETPRSLEEALGDRMSPNEARACIGCHTTNAVTGVHLHVQTMTLGIGCEACHGPGGEHVKAVKAGHLETTHIFNPGKLAGGELDDFCGACHRTWWQVLILRTRGVNNVRFQPYRLENSRCWDADDKRISCIACHDPHQHRRREVAFYTPKCLACHASARTETRRGSAGAEVSDRSDAKGPKSCPVSNHECISCHMPRYELPGGHFRFTDHQIRVVRAGEPYPN